MFGGTFRMPWHGYLLLSLIVAAFAVWMHSDLVRVEQEKKAALVQQAPAPVALADFQKQRDIHLADEVNVLGWINPVFNTHLVKGDGGRGGERLMFVLFDGADGETAGIARAAILIPSALEQNFRGWVARSNPAQEVWQTRIAQGYERDVYQFNGRAVASPDLGQLAIAAMDGAGLTPAPDFIFIDPYLEGREVALAADPAMTMQLTAVVGAVSMVLLFAAISNFDRSRAVHRANVVPEVAPEDLDDFGAPQVRVATEARVPMLPELEDAPDASEAAAPAGAANWLRSPLVLILLAFIGIASATGSPPRVILMSLVPAFVVAAVVWAVLRMICNGVRAAKEGRTVTRAGLFGDRKVFAAQETDEIVAKTDDPAAVSDIVPLRQSLQRAPEPAPRPRRRKGPKGLGINAVDVRSAAEKDRAKRPQREPEHA
ncbi:hypothetical protein SAMN05421757_11448 [Tropicimonas sediminicola]|uniref:Uncharacterized protein n=2 Tax=Tropicimonas sediminicola TaxID=1031541 RepID=A0A239MB69_9RHOB|nr:hypothetical protein SAMN05421757_11448 [Tropicimonas sediminicola]